MFIRGLAKVSRKEKFSRKKHKGSLLKRSLLVLVLLVFGGFIGSHIYFQNHFKFTKINNVDVSGLTVAQATKKLNNTHIDENGNYLVVRNSRIKINQSDVKQLFKDRSSMGLITSKKLNTKSDVSTKQYAYRIKTLLPQFKNRIDQINTDRTPTSDSKVLLKDQKLVVKKGKQGNELDKAAMVKSFKKQAKDNLMISVKMKKEVSATPTSTTIVNQKKQLRQALKNTVTLRTYNKTYHFVAKNWLTDGQPTATGKYKFNSVKIKNWVAKFAAKVDTAGKSLTITAPKRVRIAAGGTYGWKINQTTLSNAILKNLQKQDSATLKLSNYAVGTGYGTKGVGKTYVAVDLKNLEEYVYKDGKLKVKVPIMSGTLTGGNATPKGSYYIMYRQRHATLRGKNSDGSKYASPVGYWEPITMSGVGLHDSPWQPALVYGNPSARGQYHSHGCLNNPPSKMPSVWKYTHTNEPVVIYY